MDKLTNFTIFNPQAKNLLNALGFKPQHINKVAKGAGIEKSLDGTEFIKTGKDITDKLSANNTKMEVQIDMYRKQLETMKKTIGADPDGSYDYWENDDQGNKISEPYYNTSFDEKVCADVSTSNLNGISYAEDAKQTADISKTKRQYNDIVRSICRLRSQVSDNKVYIRNIKPTQKIKLNGWDLRRYGF